MIEALSSYLTLDFYKGFASVLFLSLFFWYGFRVATRLVLFPALFYGGFLTFTLSAQGYDSTLVVVLLAITTIMLVTALRHAVLTYVLAFFSTVQYYHGMGVDGIPPLAAGIGVVLSLAYGSLYFFHMRQMARRERIPAASRKPIPTENVRGGEGADLAIVPRRQARYTFANIIGMAETKAKLLQAGREAIQKPGRGEQPRNGILLSGEPGNGKTFFAEALAGELGLPFIKLTNAEAASRWINETTENIKKTFDDARLHSPCMLFVDEVDSFLESRETNTGDNQELNRTANAILTLINDLRGSGVLLVAATNFRERLDQAGVREGRFDFKVEIPPPDEEARCALLREAIIGKFQEDLPAFRTGIAGMANRSKPVVKIPCITDLSGVERAAKRWEGFSVARIVAVGKEAVEEALREGRSKVGFDDLMQAMRALQGSLGDRIPEDTPGIDGVFMPEGSGNRLKSIALRMNDIERIESLGGTLPSGVLFYGPPGTGKTFAARALAKETGWAFIVVNGQELLSDRDAVKKLIKRARDIRPVIVFIDEADDVLADRSANAWNKAVTNDLLTAMDGVKGKVPDIVWIAATNIPDALDSAVVRGGRFTEKILFGLPDETTLATYITHWRSNSRSAFDTGLTPGVLAEMIGQVSIANVQAILQTAVNHMIGHGHDRVMAEHVVAARDEVLMGN